MRSWQEKNFRCFAGTGNYNRSAVVPPPFHSDLSCGRQDACYTDRGYLLCREPGTRHGSSYDTWREIFAAVAEPNGGNSSRFTFLPLPQQLSRKSFPHLRRGRSDSVPDGWQQPCHWAAIYGAFSESICPIPQPELNTFDFTSEKCGISRLEDAAFSRLIVY